MHVSDMCACGCGMAQHGQPISPLVSDFGGQPEIDALLSFRMGLL